MLREQHAWRNGSVRWSRRRSTSLVALLVVALLPCVAAAQVTEKAKQSKPTAPENLSAKPSAKSTAKKRAERTKPADVTAQADALVKDALYYEIYGDAAQRDRLLAKAREVAPNFAPAMWQSGHVKLNDRWMKADDVNQLAANNKQLARYVAKRNESMDTAAGHLTLAHWCESRGLDDQARAHYTNVLDFQPDHAEARNKLGFRRLNGMWVTEQEVQAVNDEAKRIAKSIETWSPIAIRIREGLLGASEKNRKAAEQELAKINDVNAIPVLERALSGADETCAVKLVNKLSEFHDPQSTRSLARQSLYSPWEAVRQLSSHKLQGRPYEEYVPNLLDMLRTTVRVSNTLINRGGQLVLREFFVREGPNAWELLTIDTAYTREAIRNGDANDTLARAIADMRRTAAARQMQSEAQNNQQGAVNERIMETLKLATGETTKLTPEDWWDWWNKYNEMDDSAQKAVASKYNRTDRRIADEKTLPEPEKSSGAGQRATETEAYARREGVTNPPWRRSITPLTSTGIPPVGESLGTPRSVGECFAAGTPVWTMTGKRPIDELRIGDMVLSQDTESGELAYKPILRRTVRPSGPVFNVEIEGETYRASGGHLFWVAGEGWIKARHLRSGDVLHCCGGTATVSESKEAKPETTYNVVVADFSTYFVGENKILSHDVTLRDPSRTVVPGMPRE